MREQKLPMSKRLLRCGDFVAQGARVADIGCDHGYLSIALVKSGKAAFVHACDLREQPLNNAKKNALRFGVAQQLRFSVADGLSAVDPQQIDTVICAGMGGELMARLIEAAPWLQDPRYRLILQPQSSGNVLRRRLWEMGFAIEQEALVEENGFIYNILLSRFGPQRQPTFGEEYCSAALLRSGEALLPDYLQRVENALSVSVEGIMCSREPGSRNLSYYKQALEEIRAMKEESLCAP